MKRRNSVPGVFALNYLLSFNNKLHTSKAEAALADLLEENLPRGCCRAVPSSAESLWERGPACSGEDGLGREEEINPLQRVLAAQMW